MQMFIVIYGLPLIAAVAFLAILVRYLGTDRSDRALYLKRRRELLIAGIVAGLMVLALIMLHLFMAIAIYDL